MEVKLPRSQPEIAKPREMMGLERANCHGLGWPNATLVRPNSQQRVPATKTRQRASRAEIFCPATKPTKARQETFAHPPTKTPVSREIGESPRHKPTTAPASKAKRMPTAWLGKGFASGEARGASVVGTISLINI